MSNPRVHQANQCLRPLYSLIQILIVLPLKLGYILPPSLSSVNVIDRPIINNSKRKTTRAPNKYAYLLVLAFFTMIFQMSQQQRFFCKFSVDISCIECLTNAKECSRCNNNLVVYQLNKQNCINCPSYCNCSGETDNNTCVSCKNIQYYFESNWCYKCDKKFGNCKQCSETECTSCKDNYRIDVNDQNSCKLCNSLANCQQCQSIYLKCTNCSSGYRVNPENEQQCIECNTSFGSQCIQCQNSPSQCNNCIDNYVPNSRNNSQSCSPCSSVLFKCKQCSSETTCTKCQDNFIIHLTIHTLHICVPCSYPCLSCSQQGTNCTSCVSNNLFILQNNECKRCHQSGLEECNTCEDDDKCLSCLTDQHIVDQNGKCVACNQKLQGCSNCKDEKTCLKCSLTHLINTTSNKCDLCSVTIPNCQKCITEEVCLQCSDQAQGKKLYLKYPPKICVTCQQVHPKCQQESCQASDKGPVCKNCIDDGFYLSSNGRCYACPNTCTKCEKFAVCTECIEKFYFLKGGRCIKCTQINANCVECTNNAQGSGTVTCDKCINGYIKATDTTKRNCHDILILDCQHCEQSKFAQIDPNVCVECSHPCKSCISQQLCLSCVANYEYNTVTRKCQDYCGDRVVITDECDNGLGIKNDGCSDSCKIDKGYYCELVKDSDGLNRSVCSFQGQFRILLHSITKEDFQNLLTFRFLIRPYVYGLPETGAPDSEYDKKQLQQIFQLIDTTPKDGSSLPRKNPEEVEIENILVNGNVGMVSIILRYTKNINNDNFQMTVNNNYLFQQLNSTIVSSKEVKLSQYQPQTQIGLHHSQQQYASTKKLHLIFEVISILSAAAFLIGIFTKQVAGLQLAMLCQFTFISLFYYQGTLELPYFAMKGLSNSTGFNSGYQDQYESEAFHYILGYGNPPQSRAMRFDPRSLSRNFNLMAIPYVLLLFLAIPFILLKFKLILKLWAIEVGKKWADLVLGEIYLSFVLFNFQFLLFCTVTFLLDGRGLDSFGSIMIAILSWTATLVSFLLLICKPSIYGNFRTAFRFKKDLRAAVLQENQTVEQQMLLKFEERSQCSIKLKKLCERAALFINESALWRNYRECHLILTYNHYSIIISYFAVCTLLLAFVQESAVIIVALSAVMTLYLIFLRPYGSISEKLRAIYFGLCMVCVSLSRFLYNGNLVSQNSFTIPIAVAAMLSVGVLWTYIRLIRFFYNFIIELMSNRHVKVAQIFKDKKTVKSKGKRQRGEDAALIEQEEAEIQKLMKRYERVELKHNYNHARDELLRGFEGNYTAERAPTAGKASKQKLVLAGKVNDDNTQNSGMQSDIRNNKFGKEEKSCSEERAFKENLGTKIEVSQAQNQKSKNLTANQEQNQEVSGDINLSKENTEQHTPNTSLPNFKNLRQQLVEHKLEKWNEQNEKKAFGEQMFKLLSMDNPNKYDQMFQEPTQNSMQRDRFSEEMKMERSYRESPVKGKRDLQAIAENAEQYRYILESNVPVQYHSVQPQNLEEAKEKLYQENIMLEQNQHLRYQRAIRELTKHGLSIDRNLIREHYDEI